MNDEECDCLKGEVCCKCGKLLKGDELKSQTNPFASDVWDDHSEHLICYKCAVISAEEI